MASTLYQHFARLSATPEAKARQERYQAYKRAKAHARIGEHTQRLVALADNLPAKERDQVNAELAALEIERKHAEHVNSYNQMTADYQNALRAQVQQSRALL